MSKNSWENCCFWESVIPCKDYPTDIERKFWEVIEKIKTSIGKLIKKLS